VVSYLKRLQRLSRITDLDDTENIKNIICSYQCTESYKELLANAALRQNYLIDKNVRLQQVRREILQIANLPYVVYVELQSLLNSLPRRKFLSNFSRLSSLKHRITRFQYRPIMILAKALLRIHRQQIQHLLPQRHPLFLKVTFDLGIKYGVIFHSSAKAHDTLLV